MRILVLLLFFGFLSPASGNIRFEEVSQQAGITRIGEAGATRGETLVAMATWIYGLPIINTNRVSIETTVMELSRTLLTKFGMRTLRQTHTVWRGQILITMVTRI